MNLLINAGAKRGLGFHLCASGGNEIILNAADYLAYEAECPEIDVIATYIEAAPKESDVHVSVGDAGDASCVTSHTASWPSATPRSFVRSS